MDETSVCLIEGNGTGKVFIRRAVQRATLSNRRKCRSHVGVLCDRPDLQRHLPQFIVDNERCLLARDTARLRAAMPGYIRLVRRESSWLDSDLFALIVRTIVAAVRPHVDEYQNIFSVDAASIHVTPRIFA